MANLRQTVHQVVSGYAKDGLNCTSYLTQNTDGSSLTNLGGYRIYYGNSTQAMTQSIQITNAGLTSYTVGNLTPGTYFFSLAAYTTDGVESAPSAVGSKTIM